MPILIQAYIGTDFKLDIIFWQIELYNFFFSRFFLTMCKKYILCMMDECCKYCLQGPSFFFVKMPYGNQVCRKINCAIQGLVQISIELRLHISRSKKEGNLKLGKVLLVVEFSKQQILRKTKKVISRQCFCFV